MGAKHEHFDGTLLRRGEDGYERARRGAVWNARTPDRHPEAIVLAASEADALAGVRLARREGLTVTVRSGGHSWAGNHLRDGSVLLDLSALRGHEVDEAEMTATVQPGCRGDELLAALAERELFFPAGHCPGVGLGGYLLQGGYGWNGRLHGPACMSVEAIDVITAEGELVRADETQNSDLLWAARGAGPGFFGVVTRFHLRLQRRPRITANALVTYPTSVLAEVFAWAQEIAPRVPRTMELMLIVHRDESGEPEIAVTAPVLVDGEDEAREALALLQSCPVLDAAKLNVPYVELALADLYAGVHASYPDEHRYAVDNMWTSAPAADLIPGLERIAATLPGAPSHMLWMNWGPGATPAPPRPEMAYSCEDDTYIALYAVWEDPALDERNIGWATGSMREMAPLASGIQLADENLGLRPARFAGDEQMRRLDELRAKRDPDGRFHEWLGR
ncbi:MAG TPA: FAD-binding oxidoreductase [Solirubrobacteraceae bacterium]|nr:FAD-binding oxidoreductase [Solirubrobacteraceae bacterium]